MPRYEFKALDTAGVAQLGTMDAQNPNEVVRQLSNRGLRVQHVKPTPNQPAAVQPVFRAASQPAIARPYVAAQTPHAAPPMPQVPAHPGYDPVGKVKNATEKDTYFLFAQLANLFQSGLGATRVMDDMANRTRNKGWAPAFRHIAQLVSTGTALSVGMSIYDGIFSPGAIGAVEAGETGGYLWQACAFVSDQAKSTMKLKAVYNWVSFIFWSNVLSMPLIGVALAAARGAISSINLPDQKPLTLMWQHGVHALFGPWGAITALSTALYLFLRWWLAQPRCRKIRHQTSVMTPLLKQRTEAASSEAFAWHLQMLQNAAISPHRSWALAAKSVPNVVLSEQLAAQCPAMSETSRLSEGFMRTRLFPEEMGHLLQTGEMTGNVGQALDDARQMSHSRVQQYQAILVVKGFIWIGLITFVCGALSVGILMRGYYDTAFEEILKDTDQSKP